MCTCKKCSHLTPHRGLYPQTQTSNLLPTSFFSRLLYWALFYTPAEWCDQPLWEGRQLFQFSLMLLPSLVQPSERKMGREVSQLCHLNISEIYIRWRMSGFTCRKTQTHTSIYVVNASAPQDQVWPTVKLTGLDYATGFLKKWDGICGVFMQLAWPATIWNRQYRGWWVLFYFTGPALTHSLALCVRVSHFMRWTVVADGQNLHYGKDINI